MKPFVPGLFFLLFAGLGLWSSIDLYQSGDSGGGTTSLVLGLILMSASVFAIRSASKRTRKKTIPKPWLNRPDWAAGRIPAQANRSSVPGLAAVGVACMLGAVYLFATDSTDSDLNGFKWVALLFGVAFSGGSIHLWCSRNKFGKSFFTMENIPVVIGGNLEGIIVVTKQLPSTTETVQVKLSAMKTEPRRDEDTVARILWESPAVLSQNQIVNGMSRIAVQIPIPTHLPESGKERVFWKLEAYAKLDGLDYTVDFEVPVFAVDPPRNSEA